jgi:transcriptional regulator with XRE-family HTH domain
MTIVNKNVKFLRAKHGWTQKQLAEKLGLKQSVIGSYEEGRATPPLPCLLDMSQLFQVSLDVLTRKDLSTLPEKEWTQTPGPRSKEVLAITVDSDGHENVELVLQKASAGYLSGYQDPEFVKDLPKVALPVLPKNRTYRAFEIQGDSMLPIHPGSIVFGEYQESLAAIKNGKPYVLVTQQEGIVFKRVFTFADQEGKLLLVSDNRAYAPYAIDAADLLEIWSAKGFFTTRFPDAAATAAVATDQLAHTVLSLQDEIKKLKKS